MRNLLLCAAIVLVAQGCKDGGSTSAVPTSISVTPGSVSLDAVGATQVVRASVSDQRGTPMRNAQLTWTSSSAAVTVAGAGGDSAVVTAAGNGPATITASAGGATGTAAVQVAQVATRLEQAGGDGQTGTVGSALPGPVRVRVLDRLGAPAAGVAVSFVATGGGTVSAVTPSGADGIASATWTLGTSTSSPQQVSASAPGVDAVQFFATAAPGPAAAVEKTAGDGQSAVRGTAVAVPPRVQVRDAFGNPVAGVGVQFTVTGGGGSVTGGAQTTGVGGSAAVTAWTMGAASGINTLTATFPGTPIPAVVFTATGAAPGIVIISSGNNQAVMAGTAVPSPPTVVVRDAAGNGMAGQTVTFTVTSGGGTVLNATATTGAGGGASAGAWVMGAAGGLNTLTASVAGVASPPVVFRGVGCTGGGPGYALTLCFTSPMSASQRAAFQSAAARWSAVITGDVPDIAGTVPAGTCAPGTPSLYLNFDDLVIFAAVEPIDGPGQVLGSAGPCLIRTEGSLPILGVMRFDEADVAGLEANGAFESVILHEMGHVIGIGTLWPLFDLLQNASANTPLDTYYSGVNGRAGFDAVGGATYTGGQKVPVENTGGAGTRNGHWRESVLGSELMTGYLNSGTSNPLSVLTVRSLMDFGYTVDVAAADAFSVALTVRGDVPRETIRIKLHNDIHEGPLYRMDRQGRVTRVRD